MRIIATSRCLLCLLLLISGCRSRSDLVEAELRTKDRMLREAQGELDRSRMINESLEREFLRTHQGLPPAENSALLPPKDITLGSGTGGINYDRLGADENLEVVLVPRDEDGNPVRVVGALTISAWEILPGGVKVPLSSWDVSAADLRRTWKSGLLGSGYFVVLSWKKWPTQDRMRIAVQFALPDGRVYEADKDISIHPLKQKPIPDDKMPLLPSMPAPPPNPGPGPFVPEVPAQILAPRPSVYGQPAPVVPGNPE